MIDNTVTRFPNTSRGGTDQVAYETGSIRQIHRRLVNDGHCVAESSLRKWVKQGIVPAAFCGNRAYIQYKSVLKVLEEGTPFIPKVVPAVEQGIRRID